MEEAKSAEYESSGQDKDRSEEYVSAKTLKNQPNGTECDEQADNGVKDGCLESEHYG